MHRVTINILCLVNHLVTELFRDAIPNTLMWPVLVEKVFVFIEYVLESVQPQDNQMVQAFFTQTSNPTLCDCIGVGASYGVRMGTMPVFLSRMSNASE